jgi:VIT1/CCC1 family predicted Fe2+/Mn2+ transporter
MTDDIPEYVVLDLLPLYFEGEISEESARLIERYLSRNPKLAALSEQADLKNTLQEIPAPINKESEMEALRKAKRLMVQHNAFLAAAIVLSMMTALSYLFLSDEPRGAVAPLIFGGLAVVFWVGFFMANRGLSE